MQKGSLILKLLSKRLIKVPQPSQGKEIHLARLKIKTYKILFKY